MRGVILAGGTGSRLSPLTRSINKHLLPVGGKRMIEWPLAVLLANGIEDITIVSSPEGVGQLASSLGAGRYFWPPGHASGLRPRFTYRVQERPGGIAHALGCAETASQDMIAVILGDNVFLPAPSFASLDPTNGKTKIFVTAVDDPKPFGVVELDESGNVLSIEEKPSAPKSNLVMTGLYIFTDKVFQAIRKAKPSGRGELEMMDVLGEVEAVKLSGWWGDAGTFEGLRECNQRCWEEA